jgi:hypothetical protein
MPGHESAALELVSRAGLSISLDMQSRDLVESDRFGRYARRYAVNGAALVLEGAGHWLTDEATGRARRVSSAKSARLTQVRSRAKT